MTYLNLKFYTICILLMNSPISNREYFVNSKYSNINDIFKSHKEY